MNEFGQQSGKIEKKEETGRSYEFMYSSLGKQRKRPG